MTRGERIVAIGLLTQRDLDVLGADLSRVYPLPQASDFDDLLAKLDQVTTGATLDRPT